MNRASIRNACIGLILSLAGCNAGGDFAVVGPAAARGPVTKESGTSATIDGIDYEAVRVEDQLVLHFVNRTGATLRLTGESAIVDARGRAFAVAPQEIVAGGSGRVLVPPALADAAPHGERRPIASEVRVGGIDEGGILPRRDDGVARPDRDEPTFRWPGGTTVRATLDFDAGGKRLSHVWTLRKE